MVYMKTLNTGKALAVAAGVILTSSFAIADAAEGEGFSFTPGKGISYGEQQIVSAEVGVGFDSKYMTYGVIDGKDPIATLSGKLTFFDWVYVALDAQYDLTKTNGRRGGYGNRAGKYTLLDTSIGIAHEFDLGETIGTLGVDASYMYEYLPRYHGEVGDTQYLNLELTLDGHWIEPTFTFERDLMADEGTYVNLNLGHTFTLVGDEEDQVLTFKPSIGQGAGNSLRTKGYFGETSDGYNHGGLMDTTIMGEFEWAVCDWLSLGAYVAYYDYIFDSKMRDAARAYNSEWGSGCHDSYNVVWGLSLTAKF